MNYHKRKALLLATLFSMQLGALAQSVSINLNNVSVKQAITALQQKSGYSFVYEGNGLNTNKKVSVNAKDLKAAIAQIIEGQNLQYEIKGKNIVVSRRKAAQQRATTTSKGSSKKVSGTVLDAMGEPIIGATIRVKGQPEMASVSDIDGNFTMDVPAGAELEISYIGYQTSVVGEKSQMAITLKEDNESLDEVLVVGYGTARKVTTTSSVTKVEGDLINKMTVSNAEKSLQGLSSGLTVVDRGGAPGEDSPEIYLRGVSTTGHASPLVLVDGIEMSLSQVPASDIENISVLKDASSTAIYGSRAANGVILVTTKRGQAGKFSVTYNGTIGIQDRAIKAEAVSAREYMSMVNEALVNSGGQAKYSEDDIMATERGGDPYNHVYNNWPDEVYKSTYITQHTVSVNGGSKEAKYMTSFDYLDQPGLTKNTDFKRYSYRLNTDLQLLQNLKASTDITFVHHDRSYPQQLGSAQARAFTMTPTTPNRYENGNYRLDSQNINVLSYLDKASSGMNEYNKDAFYGQVKVDYEPIKDLTLTGVVSMNGTWTRNKVHYKNYRYYDGDGNFVYQVNSPNGVADSRNNSYEMTYRFLANYKKTFGDHSLALLGGAEQISYRNYYSQGRRNNLISDDLPDVSLGSADSQFAYGYPSKWGINSFFGRFNYNYKERYLFEANVRADGSSRFAKGHKWGTFPSFSGAWRISEEAFMKNVGWVSNLKMRASWGQTGNEHIDAYQYLAQYTSGTVVIDGSLATAIYQSQMANPNITWETVEQTDLGLDFALFNSMIYGEIDYYRKDTKDILLQLAIPYYIGLGAPQQNAGKVRNEGIEMMLGFRKKLGEVNFNTNVNFSYNKNQWVDRADDDNNISGWTIQSEGHPLNAFYIYQADGLIKDEADLADYKQRIKSDPRGMSEVKAGDVKLVDVNGDGTIDPSDRVIKDSNIPKYILGWNISAEWKGFDLSMLIQGSFGAKSMLYGEFIEGPSYEVFTSTIFRDRWTEDNQVSDAKIPRLEAANNRNESTYNTFFLKDVNYLRLKNIQLGYTFPKSVVKSFGAQSLRIYASASNLFTWTSLYQGLDPERFSGRINSYPQTKNIVFGVNVTF